MNNDLQFTTTPEAVQLGIQGSYFLISGLTNKKADSNFDAYRVNEIERLKQEYSLSTIEQDSILAGFRTLHTKVGRSNKKFVSSPENLIGMLLRNGTIPSINLLVDIYNLVSLQTKLALGAHDVSKIEGNVTLRLTDGTEKFLPLGKSEYEPIPAGEYGYIDDSNEVICRLEYRQVEKTKITLDTTECFFIVQGNGETSSDYIKTKTKDLVDLLHRYCGGEVKLLFEP
jgi:DNA/RNA-binding domain of Phe-tRNA-synthetase-like protein